MLNVLLVLPLPLFNFKQSINILNIPCYYYNRYLREAVPSFSHVILDFWLAPSAALKFCLLSEGGALFNHQAE